jgi:hypothetical protein
VALDPPATYPPGFDFANWGRSAAEFREELSRYYATFLVHPSVMC